MAKAKSKSKPQKIQFTPRKGGSRTVPAAAKKPPVKKEANTDGKTD
ncbi:hypothetical protein ACL7TT_14610 [Microbulbifer sp. 2304DJ12-6]